MSTLVAIAYPDQATAEEVVGTLSRLQTDRVDLLQLHAVGDLGELDAATGPEGALSAAIRAEEEGLVGAIGITGHGHQAPATHLEAAFTRLLRGLAVLGKQRDIAVGIAGVERPAVARIKLDDFQAILDRWTLHRTPACSVGRC